jgi:hypothetical protein
MKRTSNNEKALDAFIGHCHAIDEMLERLKALSDDHFNVAPDEVHWGHVGDVAETALQLRRITDRLFHEGEYAE